MRRLTEDEMVEKYNSYLPVDINCFSHLLDFVGISRSELGVKELQPDTEMKVEHLNQEIARYFPPGEVEKDALRVLLLDLSQFFSGHSQMIYDVVEAPLGLIYLMTYLNHRFGSKINGKIAKSRIDFDNYQGLKELLEEFKPDIIGIRTLTFFKDFFHQTAAMIRQWGIEAPIIVGGPYATSSYKECLQDGNIDLVVLGEGEITFSQVIQTIMENHRQLPGDEFLESIPGIAFRPGRHRLPQQRGRQLVMLDRLSRQLSLESGENLLPLHQPADTAYIIFTSGSTGKPKGAIVEHGGMMNHIHAKIDDLRLTAASIVAQNASHTFDISVWQFFAALVSGGKTVIYSNQLMLEPGAFISRIDDDKITILEVVPSYLSVMLDTLAITPGKFRQLDYLLVTGEVVKPNLVKGWFEKFPGIKMVNAYGPTEASDDITHFIMDKPIGMERVPIGKPIRNLTIYLLDEYMNLCPPGITGEICVSGIGVGRGYLNNPELTAEKFINPKSQIPNKAGYYRSYRSYKSYILYKTGDLGRWLPDGSIEFLGRKDYQVKIRGFRIEVEEIEKQILNHGSFKEAVVIDKEDKQASKYLCAYLTGGENSQLPGLKSYLEKQLPGYMVPAYFVELMEMPLTPNGKIDRKALPDPTGISLPEASQYVPPVSDLEKKLVEIWEKVLGRKNIGINANFFMTGGDSIKAIQIMARMSGAGYKLDIRDLFQYPVISQLAPYIKKMEGITEQTAITGTIPLTPIQEEFFNKSYSAPHHYNQAVLLFSKEGFDKGVIEEVFTRIQEHHDALRMTYKKDGDSGQIVQVAHGLDFPLSLHQYDLRNRATGLEEFKTKVNQIQASIDLEKGPLMKLGLFRLDKGDRLLVVVHHPFITWLLTVFPGGYYLKI
jgi:amino acid adenylation domain-containing protein